MALPTGLGCQRLTITTDVPKALSAPQVDAHRSALVPSPFPKHDETRPKICRGPPWPRPGAGHLILAAVIRPVIGGIRPRM